MASVEAVIPPIVTPEHLPDPVVLADVRWYLDGRDGRAAFTAAHLPGAVFVDLDTVLSGPGKPTDGRHPLPDPARFAEQLGALGIGDDDVVVAYDDSGGGTAGRLVWMLRAVGQPAALLSGGLTGWPGPVASGPEPPRPPVTRTVRPWPAERFATVDDVRRGAATLIDARSPDRYRGDHEPVDRVAGHIPGALNVPWQTALDEHGRVAPVEVLRARFTAAGVAPGRPVIASCGSGVSACIGALALEAAGWADVRLFVPSWSGWSADPANPVATGDR